MVGGIGDGTFVIFLFTVLSFLICFLGAKSYHSGAFYCGGFVLWALVTSVVVFVPREAENEQTDATTEYDEYFLRRMSVVVILSIFSIVSFLAWVFVTVIPSQQGVKLRSMYGKA